MGFRTTLSTEPVQFLIIASIALPIFLDRCDIKNRRGGYLCGITNDSKVVLHGAVGLSPLEKVARYKEFSKEKCTRVLKMTKHRSSYESRSPSESMYGGAVKLDDGALGFSGFEELDDEAFVLTIAMVTEDISVDEAREIAAKENETFRKIIAAPYGSTPILWQISRACRRV